MVDPIVDDVELDIPPACVVGYGWVDTDVREYFSKYDNTPSLKCFIVDIDMLDAEAPDGIVSLYKCYSSNIVCLQSDLTLGDYFFLLFMFNN